MKWVIVIFSPDVGQSDRIEMCSSFDYYGADMRCTFRSGARLDIVPETLTDASAIGRFVGSVGTWEMRLASSIAVPAVEKANRFQREYASDHARAVRAAREACVESLSNILLGDCLPVAIVKKDTREEVVPTARKVTKTLLRKVVDLGENVDIKPSMVRIHVMQILGAHWEMLAKLDAEYRFSLFRQEVDAKRVD